MGGKSDSNTAASYPESDNRGLFVQSELGDVMVAFYRVAGSTACCRVLPNLRQAASPRGPSMILGSINPTSATAPGEETNKAETIRFETHGARNDEGNSCQQADEYFVVGCGS